MALMEVLATNAGDETKEQALRALTNLGKSGMLTPSSLPLLSLHPFFPSTPFTLFPHVCVQSL